MAYNSDKGPQHTGDIHFESDPDDTQIDFENDLVAIKTNALRRFTVSGSFITSSIPISCSVGITASHFLGDGSSLTGLPSAAITSYTNGGTADRIITSVDGTSVNAEANLTFDGTLLTVNAELSAAFGVTGSGLYTEHTFINSTHFSSSLNVSGAAFYGDGSKLTGVSASPHGNNTEIQFNDNGSFGSNAGLTFASGLLTTDRFTANGNMTFGSDTSDTITVNVEQIRWDNLPAGTDNTVLIYEAGNNRIARDEIDSRVWGSTLVDGTGADNQVAIWTDADTLEGTANFMYEPAGQEQGIKLAGKVSASAGFSGSGIVAANSSISASMDIAASGAIHANAFYGSGQHLTNLPSAAITTYNNSANNRVITSVDSTTVQGETNLTFDGSTLNITGDMSGSGTIKSGTSISASVDISAAGSIHANAFYGDGQNLTNLPSAAITTYNGAVNNRVITAVNSSTVEGESNLTFDGTTLTTSGLSNTGNTTLGDAGSDTITINAGTITIAAIGTDTSNTVLIRNGSDNIKRRDIDSRVWGTTLVDASGTPADNQVAVWTDSNTVEGSSNLTFNGSQLTVAGAISGSGTIKSGTSISASVDVSAGGAIHANAFYGDGSNLTNLPGGGAVSGSDRHYSTIGLETSGYLKVSGSTTLAGTLRSAGRIEKTIHNFHNSTTSAFFIPTMGSVIDDTTPDYRQQFIAPFNGRLRKVWLRKDNSGTPNCTIKLFVASNGTTNFDSGGSEIEAVTVNSIAADTATAFNLSGSSHFTAGQIIGIQIQFTNSGPNNTNLTCIWEYDDRDV
tara:strand:+ start:5864 stop:8242 length:2379 start_codon:yes stop_codon:yes gene_type:complete